MTRVWSYIYVAAAMAALALGLIFPLLGIPLTGETGAPCRDMVATGSHDDLIPLLLIALAAPVALRIRRLGHIFSHLERVVLVTSLAPFAITLIGFPGCASLGANFGAANLPFTAILLALGLVLISGQVLWMQGFGKRSQL